MTGASGFIGGAVTHRVLDRAEVRSLTSHPAKDRFGGRVQAFGYAFDRPHAMADAFRGVDVFVNSYFVRFNYAGVTFDDAVARNAALVALARDAGVRRIVHVSVSNASEDSILPYYEAKGRIERLIRDSGIPFTILRPALVVGEGDILVNNIAYFLRRLPVFTIFGTGAYRLQPITADAFAEIAVEAIDGGHTNATVAAAGPRDWTFLDLVRAIRSAIAARARLVHAPAWMASAGLKVAGAFLRDVVLTKDEIEGLTREFLVSPNPVRRGVDFGEWLFDPRVRTTLGRHYESELKRHFR